MELKVGDITILYNENDTNINEVALAVLNNHDLIYMCLGEDKTIDGIENFDDFFRLIVSNIYRSKDMMHLLNQEGFMDSLLIESLIRESGSEHTIFERSINVNDELLSSLIAYKFFMQNHDFEGFLNYLKVRNREEEIFNWLKEQSRWSSYNFLLNSVSESLLMEDESISSQMSFILDKWYNEIVSTIKKNSDDEEEKEYQKITNEERDKLFYEFLHYINAPQSWFNLYNEIKRNDLIVYDKETENDNSACFLDSDGKYKIKVSYSDNLRGLCSFTHEFVHYISMRKGLHTDKLLLSELPSIFFENICARFLKEKGYDEKIVNQIINDRNRSNYDLTVYMLPIITDLTRYMNNGEVKKQDKIDFYMHQVESSNHVRKSIYDILEKNGQTEALKDFLPIEVKDPSKDMDDDCDYSIDLFIRDGLLVIDGYQYLLDSYLVNKILESKSEDSIQKMIGVAESLENYRINDIVKMFNIKDAFGEETGNVLTKK